MLNSNITNTNEKDKRIRIVSVKEICETLGLPLTKNNMDPLDFKNHTYMGPIIGRGHI